MAINWKINKIAELGKRKKKRAKGKKSRFHVFLMSSSLFLIAIGIIIVNQISLHSTFKDAAFLDMFNKQYREDVNYMDTYVDMFHTLVHDACYRQGVYFADSKEESTKVQDEAKKIRGYGGIYNYVNLNSEYTLRFQLKQPYDSSTIYVFPNKLGVGFYNNANYYTGRKVDKKYIQSNKTEENPYIIGRIIYTAGQKEKDKIALMNKGDGYFTMNEGKDIWIWNGGKDSVVEYNYEGVSVQSHADFIDNIIELSEYSKNKDTALRMKDEYYYCVSDKTGQYSTPLDVQIVKGNNSGNAELALYGSNIEWKAVVNSVYALAAYEPEYVPLLFVTSNREINAKTMGNSAYAARYEELYGDEMVLVPDAYNKGINKNRYKSGLAVEGGGAETLQGIVPYIKSSNLVVGLFADGEFNFSNTDSPLFRYELVAGSVRYGTIIAAFLLIMACIALIAEITFFVSKEQVISFRIFALEWLPVELRIVLVVVLLGTASYCYQLRLKEKWADSLWIVVMLLPLIITVCMLLQFIIERKRFLGRSLLGKYVELHMSLLAEKSQCYHSLGMGYDLHKKTITFLSGEFLCLGMLVIFSLGYWYLPNAWTLVFSDFSRMVYIILTAILIGIMVCILYSYLRFIRVYAKGIEGVQQQLELMGQGDFETIVPLPEMFQRFHTEEQFKAIKNGMLEAVANEMKSERMKIDLVANVSHDIKTPLTSIINYVDLLADSGNLPAVEGDYVKILQQKSYRLRTMIQDLFDLSKATSGNLPIDFREINFSKLVQQTLADMDEQIEQSTLLFKSNLLEEVKIYSDGNRLYRVLQNLIINALKYSMDNSRVYLNLDVEEDMAVFTIKNMSREELNFTKEEVMERFFRGERSRTTEGSGLGVAIANSFTEACGGTFDIQINADLFCAEIRIPVVAPQDCLEKNTI